MENKKQSILNVFDIVVIVIAAVLVTVLLFATRSEPEEPEDEPELREGRIIYTIEMSGMQNGTAQLIKEGDKLVERSKKWDLGTVVSVEVSPTTRQTYNYNDNTMQDVDTYLTETAVIKLIADVEENDTTIFVAGSQRIRVGYQIRMNGPTYYGLATVIGIERGDD